MFVCLLFVVQVTAHVDTVACQRHSVDARITDSHCLVVHVHAVFVWFVCAGIEDR